MASPKHTQHRLLARGDASRVELCDCSSVHLTVGAVTLRLGPRLFEDLHTTISEARSKVVFANGQRPGEGETALC